MELAGPLLLSDYLNFEEYGNNVDKESRRDEKSSSSDSSTLELKMIKIVYHPLYQKADVLVSH